MDSGLIQCDDDIWTPLLWKKKRVHIIMRLFIVSFRLQADGITANWKELPTERLQRIR